MFNYTDRDLLCTILNCGELDVGFLIKILDEYQVEFYDVKQRLDEYIVFDRTATINDYIYGVLDAAADNFKIKLIDYIEENNIESEFNCISDFEPNIYTNCMDSGFDSLFSEYDLLDYSEENLSRFIEEYKK